MAPSISALERTTVPDRVTGALIPNMGIKDQYLIDGNPVITMDSKKKELLGNLYRDGHVYVTGVIEVYDHDFPYLAEGIVISNGLYDLKYNKAYVNIGVRKDTSEFACDSIRVWWENYGKLQYPNCTSILILADGGSNSSRHYIFKEDLQKLVDEIGVEIRIAHFPPYTSKWNPIEHRLFPHITRSLKGVILKSHDYVQFILYPFLSKIIRVTSFFLIKDNC